MSKESLKSISFFVGPEGGWTENELTQLKKNVARVVSLGPAILRAETAAIATTALLAL